MAVLRRPLKPPTIANSIAIAVTRSRQLTQRRHQVQVKASPVFPVAATEIASLHQRGETQTGTMHQPADEDEEAAKTPIRAKPDSEAARPISDDHVVDLPVMAVVAVVHLVMLHSHNKLRRHQSR